MARAKVHHSTDGVEIVFEGDKRSPEPSTGVIKFPGGLVEVSRCSDGSYWAHILVAAPGNVVDSRIDFTEASEITRRYVADIPDGNNVQKIALRIEGKFSHD